MALRVPAEWSFRPRESTSDFEEPEALMFSISWRAHANSIGSSRLPNMTDTLNVGLTETPCSFLASTSVPMLPIWVTITRKWSSYPQMTTSVVFPLMSTVSFLCGTGNAAVEVSMKTAGAKREKWKTSAFKEIQLPLSRQSARYCYFAAGKTPEFWRRRREHRREDAQQPPVSRRFSLSPLSELSVWIEARQVNQKGIFLI